MGKKPKKLEIRKELFNKIFDVIRYRERCYLKVPINMIEPNSWNINVMTLETFDKLRESIKITGGKYLYFDFIKVFYDKEKQIFIIIDGEKRWRACKELGYDKMPVEYIDCDENKAKTLNVILNTNRKH